MSSHLHILDALYPLSSTALQWFSSAVTAGRHGGQHKHAGMLQDWQTALW